MEHIFPPENTAADMAASTKAKNLSALAILLAGLFIGSLFVDFVQLVTGSGFSGLAVKTHNVLETGGKTWVAYADPKITVEVLSDKECEACNPDEALVWLRRVVPTLEATEVGNTSDMGQALISRFQIKTLPAFVFSQSVAQTDFYTQASSLFTNEGNRYFFDMNAIGLPAGEYIATPQITDADITIGQKDAKVKIVEFSDFQCPYCKTFHKDLMAALRGYEDKVLYVFKNLPLTIHPQAENAALAGECANAQGKFPLYADYLFTKQDDWGKATGAQKFKDYAWYLRLNGRDFTKCLDTKKYQDQVDADAAVAATFSITGTPGTFINNTFLNGAVSAATIKQTIENELAK